MCVLLAVLLFTMAFDPISRWLHDAVIPRDFSLLEWLQPTPCANADDFAVSAPYFRIPMPAIAPAFRTIDLVTGMSLNNKKCYWVQYGNQTCDALA